MERTRSPYLTDTLDRFHMNSPDSCPVEPDHPSNNDSVDADRENREEDILPKDLCESHDPPKMEKFEEESAPLYGDSGDSNTPAKDGKASGPTDSGRSGRVDKRHDTVPRAWLTREDTGEE